MTDLWQSTELAQYVQDGYDDLVMRTGCLWATEVSPDIPFAFNITADFEYDLMPSGNDVSDAAQFTYSDERDYLDNATGPANHNHRWEFTQSYATGAGCATEIPAVVDLPEDLYEIERATWNTLRIEANRSRSYDYADSRYELSKGEVLEYTQDKDGLRQLRKWRVPSAAYIPYSMDTSSSEYGVLVSVSDIDSDTPQGETWGDFVQVAGEHLIGDPWGVIVAIYKETSDMRYEYRRRGLELSADQDLEIPTRYQVYVRHYAQARALEREGDGQDLEMSAWYQSRYEAGVTRMLDRKKAMAHQRKYIMGGGAKQQSRLPLARLPWNYGRVVR